MKEPLSPTEARPPTGIEDVGHVVAVASGKGGVGKTTVAVNLAVAIMRCGQRVGLLDADVYGPSVPLMLGLKRGSETHMGNLDPVDRFGLRVMSLGLMVDEGQPVIWRGPMVARTVNEFMERVPWGTLDYLIVDLPPGTGDASITIAHSLPAAGVLLVTTPQAVAVANVRRAVSMFRESGMRLLGIVENMAYYRCPDSEEAVRIFGAGGGRALSRATRVPLLASLPVEAELSRGGDAGIPLMIESPGSPTGIMIAALGDAVRARCEGPRTLQ
jgi:ATP-binding protein involved in chromosome partitioning